MEVKTEKRHGSILDAEALVLDAKSSILDTETSHLLQSLCVLIPHPLGRRMPSWFMVRLSRSVTVTLGA